MARDGLRSGATRWPAVGSDRDPGVPQVAGKSSSGGTGYGLRVGAGGLRAGMVLPWAPGQAGGGAAGLVGVVILSGFGLGPRQSAG